MSRNKYERGQKLRRTYVRNGFLMEEMVEITNVENDFMLGAPQYSIKHQDGTTTFHPHDEIDESDKYTPASKPITLIGKHKGRCECGAWATTNPDCHARWCPEGRSF